MLGCYPKGAKAKVVRRKLVSWGSVRVCVCPQVLRDKLEVVLTHRWSWALTSEVPIIAGQSDISHLSMVCGMLEPQNYVEAAEVVWVGIPREPEDFFEKAVLAGHPKSLLDFEVDPQVSLLIDNLLESQVRCPDEGLNGLKHWSDRREQLEAAESEAKTGVFVPDPRPPSTTLAAQLKTAKVSNQATIAKLATQAPDEVSKKSWGDTQEEVARGLLF